MTNAAISALLQSSLPVLKQKIKSVQVDPINTIRSYERIVCHLETLIPAICKRFGASTIPFTTAPSDAWWSTPIPGTGIFLELEKRYFVDETRRETGDHRADVVFTLYQNGRTLRVLLEYKTTSSNATPEDNALNDAFSKQLIPYLNYEVAAEIGKGSNQTDDFMCCVAVHLREENRTRDEAGKVALEVVPNLAYSLKRNPSRPSDKPTDANQHCYFVFHKWPNQVGSMSFRDWLIEQIGQLGQASTIIPAQNMPAPRTERRTHANARVANVVFGPPGSGKSTWVSQNRPHAKVFAPPELRKKYAAQAEPPADAPTSLVIEEWQHFKQSIFGHAYYEQVIQALKGPWDDLTVVVDFGQARTDNKHDTAPYEQLTKFIGQYSPQPIEWRPIPQWIPLRQINLGVAFLLWIEAVRREFNNINKKEHFYLAPAAAAQAFVKARQILVNRGVPDDTLFDIQIVRLKDLLVSIDAVSVAGGGQVDAVLDLQPTSTEKSAALRRDMAATEAETAAAGATAAAETAATAAVAAAAIAKTAAAAASGVGATATAATVAKTAETAAAAAKAATAAAAAVKAAAVAKAAATTALTAAAARKKANGVLLALEALTWHPVDIAGLEYDNILVRMERRVFNSSNQLNEILLACSRARKRLWILVADNLPNAIDENEELASLHREYARIGLEAFNALSSPSR